LSAATPALLPERELRTLRIDPGTAYRLKKHVLLAEFEAAGILFDLRSRCCLELNRTAVEVVGRLDGHTTLGQIISRLAGVYELSAEHLQKDLEAFIAMLHERSLLDDGQDPNDKGQG
jgi:hypothetical protein